MAGEYGDHPRYDFGERTRLRKKLFDIRYNSDVDAALHLRTLLKERFSYDHADGSVIVPAVVLKILSGPSANNEATTSGNLSKTMDEMDELKTREAQDRADAGKKSLTKVIAKVMSYHDSDISYNLLTAATTDQEREFIASLHCQFNCEEAAVEESLKGLKINSEILVSLPVHEPKFGLDGRPMGKIVGALEDSIIQEIIEPKTSSSKSFEPGACQLPRQLDQPESLYVSNTLTPRPTGPPVVKLKGKIKTGVFGNGTAQTKAHFERALLKAKTSYKHNIPGPTPGPSSAFIWIGHLKNNGYMDLLDRPLSPGRETIIYAPRMLDTTSPIEIKYYFHDIAGFGHSWIAGPGASVEQATKAVDNAGNDFREKVAPAIKDFIKDGRNMVIVIPEMMHSRGFGTAYGDAARFDDIAKGVRGVQAGKASGATIRTNPTITENRPLLPKIKHYLSNIRTQQNKNLGQAARFRERQFSTFDGSYTGGNFKNFHNEVLDVLKEHHGEVNLGYISILADGAGGLNLAAMVKEISSDAVQKKASRDFKNMKINQIDFINTGLDSDTYFNFPSVPSYTIFDDYLLPKSELLTNEIVFNYVSGLQSKISSRTFFNLIGHEDRFNSSFKAGRCFTVATSPSGLSKNFISLHAVQDDRVANYAFAISPETSLGLSSIIPNSSDNASVFRPPQNELPDHAQAVASKKENAALASYYKQKDLLDPKIEEFETMLADISKSKNLNFPCKYVDPKTNQKPYEVYCKNGALSYGEGSTFHNIYGIYLKNKREYKKLEILIEKEKILKKIKNNKTKLQEEIAAINKDVEEKDKNPPVQHAEQKRLYEDFKSPRKFLDLVKKSDQQMFVLKSAGQGVLAEAARADVLTDSYKQYLSRLTELEKTAEVVPDENASEECGPEPQSLSEEQSATSSPTTTPTTSCSDNIKPPATFAELTNHIPYFPKKKDFKLGKKKRSLAKTGLEEVKQFKPVKLVYISRSANDKTRQQSNVFLWECLAERVSRAINNVSINNKYYPFYSTVGLRGSHGAGLKQATAYRKGLSLHSLGMAFELDPFFNGYASGRRGVLSVFSGAWTPGIGDNKRLHELGVFWRKKGQKIDDAIDEAKRRIYEDDEYTQNRTTNKWFEAPGAYKPKEPTYIKALEQAKNCVIVGPGSNPTQWVLEFCEQTKFKWGNGKFLKKRWIGGKSWSDKEKAEIASIYGITNLVSRVNTISWGGNYDDHMHFSFWNGKGPLISWKEISEVNKATGNDK